MKLTAFTDFGLRALMCLAADEERLFNTEEISRGLNISREHLIKVVRQLARHGFVTTKRGAQGGFRLARPASEIWLGEVVERLETGQALVECFRADGGACVMTPRCKLIPKLSAARAAVIAELNKTTLAECQYEL